MTANSNSSIFQTILGQAESAIVALVLGVIAIYMPQFASITSNGLATIGKNFQAFLHNTIINGTPWGQALADMLTADWNEVVEDEKQLAIDFATDVATVLQKAGLIK